MVCSCAAGRNECARSWSCGLRGCCSCGGRPADSRDQQRLAEARDEQPLCNQPLDECETTQQQRSEDEIHTVQRYECQACVVAVSASALIAAVLDAFAACRLAEKAASAQARLGAAGLLTE